MTVRIRKVFDWFMNSMVESGCMKELEFLECKKKTKNK